MAQQALPVDGPGAACPPGNVTLTAAQLATAIRLGTSDEETAQATRLLAVATALVTRHAPAAPTAMQNEAVVRVAGYLYDQPTAAGGTQHANALRNSGAAALLLPWRVHRAGKVEAAAQRGRAEAADSGSSEGSVDLAALTARVAALETALSGGAANQALARNAGGAGFSWRAVSALIANASLRSAQFTAATVARLLPTGVSTGKFLRRTETGWEGADVSGTGGVDEENAVPFGLHFDEVYSRTFAASLSNTDGEALVSSNNSVPEGAPAGTTDFVGIDKNDSGGTEQTALEGIEAGDWFRAKRGDNYIIARIQHVDEDTDNNVWELWFNPSTDVFYTLKHDQIGTGAGEIAIYRVAVQRDSGRLLPAGGAGGSEKVLASDNASPYDPEWHDRYDVVRTVVAADGGSLTLTNDGVTKLVKFKISDLGVTMGKIAAGAVALTKLSAAVVARLLPTGIATGKYLRKTSTGWEGADAPGGSGGSTVYAESKDGTPAASQTDEEWLSDITLSTGDELLIRATGEVKSPAGATGRTMRIRYRIGAGAWTTVSGQQPILAQDIDALNESKFLCTALLSGVTGSIDIAVRPEWSGAGNGQFNGIVSATVI